MLWSLVVIISMPPFPAFSIARIAGDTTIPGEAMSLDCLVECKMLPFALQVPVDLVFLATAVDIIEWELQRK